MISNTYSPSSNLPLSPVIFLIRSYKSDEANRPYQESSQKSELYEARSYLERWQVAGRAAADVLEAGGRDGLVAFLREHGGTKFFKVIPPAGHPFREPVIQLLANHPVAEYRTGMQEMAASVPNVIPRLETLDIPVMGINGTADPFIEDPARLAGVRNFRQVEPVEGAGRFLHWECPDIFNARLTDFFGL